jgi:hypothetical protein
MLRPKYDSFKNVMRQMRESKSLLYLFTFYIFFVIFASTANAQEFSKVGTGAAQFLKIDVGARSVAMGGSYVAMADDIYAMYWNPSGIARASQSIIGGSFKKYIADLNHSFVGAVFPLNNTSSVGFHVLFMTADPIEITTIEKPRGTGTYYSYNSAAVGFSYARWLTDRLTLGTTIKFVRESIYRERAQTLAFDIGSQLDTGIYGVRLGMSLSNFGGDMRLEGPDLDAVIDTDTQTEGNRATPGRLRTLDWPLPLIFRMGIRVDLIGGLNPRIKNTDNRLTIAVAINDPLDQNLRSNFGLEYEWHRTVIMRAGYYGNYDTQTLGITLGGGLQLKMAGKRFTIDYAFQDFGILNSVHQYSLNVEL